MKILVINGSPKGTYSVTLQTSLWLEKKHPEHQFAVLRPGAGLQPSPGTSTAWAV